MAALFEQVFDLGLINRGEYLQRFTRQGFESTSLFDNSGDVVMIWIVTVGMVPVIMMMDFTCGRRFSKCRWMSRMNEGQRYSSFIRLYLESLLELYLASWLNILHLSYETSTESIASIFTITYFVLFNVVSVASIVFLLYKRHELSKEFYKERFGGLYEEYKDDKLIFLYTNI